MMNRRNQTSRIVHWTFVLLFSSISLLYISCSGAQSTGSSPPDRPDSDSVYSLPPSIQQEVVTLRAEDGRSSWGVLYLPKDKKPQTAILSMHPRGNQSRNSFFLPLVEAGFAAFGHNNRYLNNDRDGIHERMLLDIAEGVRFLKSRGFEKVVLLGQSGGGSLMAFYQAQAVTTPPGRVSSTPAGDPPNLNQFDLPPGDGLLLVIPHVGEGKILELRIDPSVINEGDPLSIDPSLDMYNPANGFHLPPQGTTYSQEFIARYREGQTARMARLDSWARDLIAEQNHYKGLMERRDFRNLPPEQQQRIERHANTEGMMTIYRTWADISYMDLGIDPSDRTVGENSGTTPWLANYSRSPTPAYISPRAFLSSRSSISSNAVSVENLPKVEVPLRIVQGTAHRAVYPSETKALLEAAGSEDKELVWIVGGDVSFNPSGPKAGKGDQRQQSIDAAVSWMLEKFPH